MSCVRAVSYHETAFDREVPPDNYIFIDISLVQIDLFGLAYLEYRRTGQQSYGISSLSAPLRVPFLGTYARRMYVVTMLHRRPQLHTISKVRRPTQRVPCGDLEIYANA